jgi:predicted lactoylglutathione lyase
MPEQRPLTVRQSTVCLPTRDLRAAFLFYRDGLGLPVAGVPEGSDEMPEPVRFTLTPGTTLMLIPTGGFDWVTPGNEVAAPGVSECLLSISVADADEVDEVVRRAEKAGGELVSGPDIPIMRQSRWFRDLDGHLWLVEPTQPTTAD